MNHSSNTRNPRHYGALLAEAERVGWPERFRTDLTEHDRLELSRHEPTEPFAWVLSDGATYLVFPSRAPIDGAGHYAHECPAFCESSFGRENCRFYWWDGLALQDVGASERLAECLRDHVEPRTT
jgi:hypothetical protein